LARATLAPRQCASTDTTTTILMLARLTVITVLIGLWAGCLSAQALGITDIGAAAAGVTVAASTDGAFMATVAIMAAVDTATVDTATVVTTAVAATLDMATRTVRAEVSGPDLGAADSMAVVVVDSTVAGTDNRKSGK